MKKWLKIWLIVWWSLLVAWWARAWLTKAWIIPNWFDIELLCPIKWYKIPVEERHLERWWNLTPFIENCECEDRDCYVKICYDEEHGIPITIFDYPCDEYSCYDKPIIYLYPTTETKVNVKLWTPQNLSHTYPKYNSEKWWNVIAQPNWELKDTDTWRKLYALYREWKSDIETNFDEWFVVAWKDIIPFLEEKLAILWLNEREAEEFIVYRLPQMEDDEWNLIKFETIEEQNENMPLNITPKPDTVIRVMMDWKAIDKPIDIPEQQLNTPVRSWFTVVEWWWSPKN